MAWADTLNVLLNLGKGFRDRGMQSQALASRSVQDLYGREAQAGQQRGDMLFKGITGFGEGIAKGVEARRGRAHEKSLMEAEQGFQAGEAQKQRELTAGESALDRTYQSGENLLDRQAQTARDEFARAGYKYEKKEWYNPWNGATRQYTSTNEGEHDINLKDIDAWIEMARAQWTKDNLGQNEDIDNEDNFRRAAAEEAEIIDRYILQNSLLPDFSTVQEGDARAWDVFQARSDLWNTPEIQEMARAAKEGLAKRFPNTYSARTKDRTNEESVDQILFPLRGKPEGMGLNFSQNRPTETGNLSASAAAVVPKATSIGDALSAAWATATGLFTGKSKEEISQDPRLMRIAENRAAKENLRVGGVDKAEENYYKDLLTAKDTISGYFTGGQPSANAVSALNNINTIISALENKDLSAELKKYDASFRQKYGMTAEQVLQQLIGYYAQNWSERGGEQEYYSGANERYKPPNSLIQAFSELASSLGR